MAGWVAKGKEDGMIVRPVAVGPDEEIQDLQVVIRRRKRQSKSSLRRRQSPQEIHRQEQRRHQSVIEAAGPGGSHEALGIRASEGTSTSSRIQPGKLIFKPRLLLNLRSSPPPPLSAPN